MHFPRTSRKSYKIIRRRRQDTDTTAVLPPCISVSTSQDISQPPGRRLTTSWDVRAPLNAILRSRTSVEIEGRQEDFLKPPKRPSDHITVPKNLSKVIRFIPVIENLITPLVSDPPFLFPVPSTPTPLSLKFIPDDSIKAFPLRPQRHITLPIPLRNPNQPKCPSFLSQVLHCRASIRHILHPSPSPYYRRLPLPSPSKVSKR